MAGRRTRQRNVDARRGLLTRLRSPYPPRPKRNRPRRRLLLIGARDLRVCEVELDPAAVTPVPGGALHLVKHGQGVAVKPLLRTQPESGSAPSSAMRGRSIFLGISSHEVLSGMQIKAHARARAAARAKTTGSAEPSSIIRCRHNRAPCACAWGAYNRIGGRVLVPILFIAYSYFLSSRWLV